MSLRNLSPRIQIFQQARGFQGKVREKVCLSPNVYNKESLNIAPKWVYMNRIIFEYFNQLILVFDRKAVFRQSLLEP